MSLSKEHLSPMNTSLTNRHPLPMDICYQWTSLITCAGLLPVDNSYKRTSLTSGQLLQVNTPYQWFSLTSGHPLPVDTHHLHLLQWTSYQWTPPFTSLTSARLLSVDISYTYQWMTPLTSLPLDISYQCISLYISYQCTSLPVDTCGSGHNKEQWTFVCYHFAIIVISLCI